MLKLTENSLWHRIEIPVNGSSVKIIALGGGAIRVMDELIESGLVGIETIAVHDDRKSLYNCNATTKIKLHNVPVESMQVLNTSGRSLIEGSFDEICDALSGSKFVVVIACLGGKTGTQGAPVVSRIAAGIGATVYNVVSLPYPWEGRTRVQAAAKGLDELKKSQDAITVIPNSVMTGKFNPDAKMNEFLRLMNTTISTAILDLLQKISSPDGSNEENEAVYKGRE